MPFEDHAGASPVSSVVPAARATSRRLVVSTHPGSMSQPMKRRPTMTAATAVVPEPRNGSTISSPGSETWRTQCRTGSRACCHG